MRYLHISLISCFLAFNSPISNAQIITTIAGNGTYGNSGDGGQATAAELTALSIDIDVNGNLYLVDGMCCVRKINTLGIISTVAGGANPGPPGTGDGGPATAAFLYLPHGVAADRFGNVFIADSYDNRVRKVNTAGIISTFAGGGSSNPGDGGPATAANINMPPYVITDAIGNVYFSDYGNNRIRMVNTAGIISTIAGNGTSGNAGDGGLATNASINSPSGIAFDAVGNLYIAVNSLIRKVNTAGIITTIAGGGSSINDGGIATAAELYGPVGITIDASGNLYIADAGNSRIRMVNLNDTISTVCGNGTQGYTGDGGLASSAELNRPYDVKVDAFGNLIIADSYNNAIRKITNNHSMSIKQNVNSNEQITVYPNPASNSLQVLFSGNGTNTEIIITDMLGNTVKQMPVTLSLSKGNTQHITLNIADLGEGVYNISITNKEGVANKRVVIVR